ncbi:MAG: MoaD/ThiS family protein [Chlorobi bacterium]|jgi:molybdopterin converting factor subunit 1|nr:MoaD/ThiS family protein [Chlorobiota bacterium]
MAKILFFAIASEITGINEINFQIKNEINVDKLWLELSLLFPKLIESKNNFRVAVDMVYVKNDFIVNDNSLIAIIPPVSGG